MQEKRLARLARLAMVAVVGCGLGCWAEPAGAAVEILAYGGMEAVGTGGATFQTFSSPSINQTGDIMVQGQLATGGLITLYNRSGIWHVDPNGQWRLVARTGDQVEGMAAGVVYTLPLTVPFLYDSGMVLSAKLAGTGVTSANDWAYFRSEPGVALELIAREGDGAIGLPGATFAYLAQRPAVDAQGRISFETALSGTGVNVVNDDALWADLGNGPVMIAREFDAVPGGLAGELYDVPDGKPWQSGNGLLQMPVYLQRDDPTNGWITYLAAVSYNSATAPTTIHARTGHQVPGETAGVFFDYLSRQSIDSAGRVLFVARYAGTGIDSANHSNDESLWQVSADGSNPMVLWRGGTTVIPDTGGSTFFAFRDTLGLARNENGDFAAHIVLQGDGITDQNDTCLVLRKADGNLILVARENDQAAGVADGCLWGANLDVPTLNDSRAMAFTAQLQGVGVTESNDHGLWIWDEGRGGRLLVREGDALEVAPGDVRTVSSIALLSALYADGGNRYTVLNNSGALVFSVGFTDGSGATALWHDASVPMQGDLNGDALVNLTDLIACLKVMSNLTPTPLWLSGDVDGDGKIGGAEALFILRKCAGGL